MQVYKEWEGNAEISGEENRSICCPAAVFHLGMGGRGGAPRVAEKTETVNAPSISPKGVSFYKDPGPEGKQSVISSKSNPANGASHEAP